MTSTTEQTLPISIICIRAKSFFSTLAYCATVGAIIVFLLLSDVSKNAPGIFSRKQGLLVCTGLLLITYMIRIGFIILNKKTATASMLAFICLIVIFAIPIYLRLGLNDFAIDEWYWLYAYTGFAAVLQISLFTYQFKLNRINN